jgi:hypothetical protein
MHLYLTQREFATVTTHACLCGLAESRVNISCKPLVTKVSQECAMSSPASHSSPGPPSERLCGTHTTKIYMQQNGLSLSWATSVMWCIQHNICSRQYSDTRFESSAQYICAHSETYKKNNKFIIIWRSFNLLGFNLGQLVYIFCFFILDSNFSKSGSDYIPGNGLWNL